jgi:hypothetical protein
MTLLAIHRESTGVIESERQSTAHLGHGTRSTSKLASYRFSLTREELSASYAIIRHNVRTYRSAGVVEVVKGKQLAESTLQKLEACQDSSDQYEGWRYFIEKTDQKPGIDPVEATQRRQQQLEAACRHQNHHEHLRLGI